MIPIKRRLFAPVLILAAALCLPRTVSAADSLRIAVSVLKGPSGIGMTWLISSPPDIPGATLSFTVVSGADLAVAKLLSGEIDAAVLPVNVAAKLFSAGSGIRALAVVGEGMVKFLSSDQSIKSIRDIRGKQIYIAGQKATPDYLFRFLAESEGLEAGKDYLSAYNLAYPEAAAALAARRIDSAVLPEPFATQAIAAAPWLASPIDLDALWTAKTGMPSYPMSVLVCTQRLLDSNAGAVRILMDSYRASIAKVVAEPEKTGSQAENLDLGLKASVAAASIPRAKYAFIENPDAAPGIAALLKIFLAFEPVSVGGKLPDAAFYAVVPSSPPGQKR